MNNKEKTAPEPSAQDEMQAAFDTWTKTLEWPENHFANTASFQAGAQWQATRQAAVEQSRTGGVSAADVWVPRDWNEDFAGINSSYENICYTCKRAFMGHKHRRICKACSIAAEQSPALQAAPSDLHTNILALPLPNADIDGYCGESAYSRECMEDFRHAIAELVANAAPMPDTVQVTKQDGNDYCRILSILGMEEDGDPVAEVQRLFDLANAPVQTAVAVPEAVKLAGAKMANTMFNLEQRDFCKDLSASFKAMQVEWDAAIRAANQPEQKP